MKTKPNVKVAPAEWRHLGRKIGTGTEHGRVERYTLLRGDTYEDGTVPFHLYEHIRRIQNNTECQK